MSQFTNPVNMLLHSKVDFRLQMELSLLISQDYLRGQCSNK